MTQRLSLSGAILFIIAVIVCSLIVTNMEYLSPTRWLVDEDGEYMADAVLDRLGAGSRVVAIKNANKQDIDHVIDLIYDSPSLFWVDMQYNKFNIGNTTVLVVRERYDEISVKQLEIDIVANDVIRDVIEPNMSEYDKVLAIHDWICENVSYGTCDNNSDQDVYGALVLKRALCAGYAESFAYLLNKAGIKSYVISGDSIDRSGESVPHAWNLVYINRQPYYFDITWNDNGKNATYDYFGVTSQEFKATHFPSRGYEWVDATAITANYYVQNGMYLESYSAKAIADQFNKQGSTFIVKCADADVFKDTLAALGDESELRAIMRQLGITKIDGIVYTENPNLKCLKITIRSPDLPADSTQSAGIIIDFNIGGQ